MNGISKLLCFLLLVSCQKRINKEDWKYQKVNTTIDNQIFYETNSDEANSDNLIYNSKHSNLYEYSYKKDNELKFYKYNFDKNPMDDEFWYFIPKDSILSFSAVKYFSTSILLKTPIEYSGYTVIRYSYLNANKDTLLQERTGLIENYKNIWAHVPRDGVFSLTFPAPWYYLKFPLKKNSTWSWTWKYNEKWGDWTGIMKFDFYYKVVSTSEFINCSFGKIECYKIEAIGKSKAGENSVIFYFNPQIGLVKARYKNLDESVIEIKLIESNYFQ